MKTWVRIAIALAACAFLSGCAASRPETKREEPPGVSVRLPFPDAVSLDLESSSSALNPELPPSVAEETRGRWLTLFEVIYTPMKPPPPLPPFTEEEPSR
ncbi:MAG: hypothetical protein WC899_08810 [bacterium]|jgi:hypothetical protein